MAWPQAWYLQRVKSQRNVQWKGRAVQLSETCLLLDLFSVGGNEKIKLAGLTLLPQESPAKMGEACSEKESLVNPQQDNERLS